MREIDKESFGQFIQALRKNAGMTQKQLAERLFVSDKAVSKWERGLSLPDVSLLMPLAEALGVTVTELLEARRMEPDDAMPAEQVETIVQRAITLSDSGTVRRGGPRCARNALIFASCLIVTAAEIVLLFLLGCDLEALGSTVLLTAGLCAVFGAYFWLFAPERLSSFYDAQRINIFIDGPMRINVPGLSFNNRNWPHICRAMRITLVAIMIGFPAVYLLLARGFGLDNPYVWLFLTLAVVLGGLFIPLYAVGKKYET